MTSAADHTTLYGAQMALEFEEIDFPEVFWPIRCLVALTAASINNNALIITKPPSSIESSTKPAGILSSSLLASGVAIDLTSIGYFYKKFNLCKTSKYFKQNRSHFLSLVKNDAFWSSKEIRYWLNWHKKNEWDSHRKRFGGIVSRDFKRQITDTIGYLHDEQAYIIDAIIRGYYYNNILNGDIWLHPIRVENMPSLEVTGSIDFESINPRLTALVLGGLLERGGTFEAKLERWMALIKMVRKYTINSTTWSYSNGDLNLLASEMGIVKWESKIERIYDLFQKFSDSADKILSIYGETPVTAPLKIISLTLKAAKPIVKEGQKYLQRKKIEKTISKGNRLLYLSKNFGKK